MWFFLTRFIFRMKPTRIRMWHSLVMNYGLYKRMEIFVSQSLGNIPHPNLSSNFWQFRVAR